MLPMGYNFSLKTTMDRENRWNTKKTHSMDVDMDMKIWNKNQTTIIYQKWLCTNHWICSATEKIQSMCVFIERDISVIHHLHFHWNKINILWAHNTMLQTHSQSSNVSILIFINHFFSSRINWNTIKNLPFFRYQYF